MHNTDIRILRVRAEFSPQPFRVPLMLSSGPIRECLYAHVEVEAENRDGARAVGVGGVYLSDLWAFPGTGATSAQKAGAMKEAAERLARRLEEAGGHRDAMQWGRFLDEELDAVLAEAQQALALPLPIPRLAGLVACAPLDAAVHDAWGKAAGMDCYAMYGERFLNEDLSRDLGSAWRGSWPGDGLADAPRRRAAVQHVVGTDDPLTALDAQGRERPDDGLPFTLEEWIAAERIFALKIKSKGYDAKEIAERIRDVHRAAELAASRCGVAEPVRLSLDPNEAFPHPDPLVELLRRLKEKAPDAFRALEYIEQPTPRDLSRYDFTLHEASALKPVIIDESLDRLERLEALREQGWSGVALKVCKGQTHSLAAYAFARRHGLFVTVQDMTNAGMAHVQSVNLYSRLAVSAEVYEFNSRQYTPFARPETRERYPSLFRVEDGRISTADIRGEGLY